jgi:hypothetical protein
MMDVGNQQIKLIKYVKDFLEKEKSLGIDSSLSGFCYLSAWDETLGYAKLKYKVNGWKYTPKFLLLLLKNILSIGMHARYVVLKNNHSLAKFNNMIISFSFKKNFQSDGSFTDRYLNENSKSFKNTHWVIVSMDDYVPNNLSNNITIIKKEKSLFKFRLFLFLKIFFSSILIYKFSLKKFFHYFCFHSHFAKILSSIIKEEVKKNDYKIILLPYEAQPFQNNIFAEVKKINNKIKTVGYNSSLLTPLPSEFVHRSGAPDFLLVHGESQVDIFTSILNWPTSKMILIESLRFRHENKDNLLENKIFIPRAIHNKDIYINEFKKLLINSPPNTFPNFLIQNQPTMINSQKHLDLISKLKKIIKNYKNRFSEKPIKKNISIFFGVTATIFEALEKNIKVIHICGDPVFESYNSKIWKNLVVDQKNKYLFFYNLSILGKHINFGKKK